VAAEIGCAGPARRSPESEKIAADHDVAALLGGARVRRDAADAMADIGRVGRLAHFAVIDHVDAGGGLLRNDVLDRFGGRDFNGVRVHRTAFLAAENEVDERLRPAAGCRYGW